MLGSDPPTVVLLHEDQHLRDAHLPARAVTVVWRRDRHAGDASVEVDNDDIWADQAKFPHRQRELCSREDPLKSFLGGAGDVVAAQIEGAVGVGERPVGGITSRPGSGVTCVLGPSQLSQELIDCLVGRYLRHGYSFSSGLRLVGGPCLRCYMYSN